MATMHGNLSDLRDVARKRTGSGNDFNREMTGPGAAVTIVHGSSCHAVTPADLQSADGGAVRTLAVIAVTRADVGRLQRRNR